MAAILLQTVFGLAIVRGGGMSPASGDGDVALTYRLEQAYSANDSLTVSKKVAGTAANTQDEFSYTLKIEGAQGSYDYVLDGAAGTFDAKDALTFKLKHGQSIEIKNLPEGATYTVTEADTAYNENFAVDGGKAQAGAVATGTIHNGSAVAYTNEKGFAPATGINSDTLPFVFGGLVVVAGAGALLISRKRRASEEF